MSEENNELISSINRIKNKMKLLTLINKAKAEYDKSNYEGCEEACRKILETEPENLTALRGMGCVMLSKAEKDKAVGYYKKALELSDNKEIDYALLGTAYYIYDEFEEAIKYFNMAIDLNENYDFAYEGRNQAMLERHIQITDLQDRLIENELRKN